VRIISAFYSFRCIFELVVAAVHIQIKFKIASFFYAFMNSKISY